MVSVSPDVDREGPTILEQSVLRTIGEEPPSQEWQPEPALARIPAGWSRGPSKTSTARSRSSFAGT
jgi:hypothetical protein